MKDLAFYFFRQEIIERKFSSTLRDKVKLALRKLQGWGKRWITVYLDSKDGIKGLQQLKPPVEHMLFMQLYASVIS